MDISPDKQNIDKLFGNTAFYIDFYQRDYKWTEEPVSRNSIIAPPLRPCYTSTPGAPRMTPFEFVFPLFGLLVGLSFAEMLGGLARALKSKRDVHVGWLTPLLGTLILINLTMFWQGAWEVRDVAAPTSVSLLLILAVGGGYFLAASMIFPTPGAEVRDLDEHFMDNRGVALLAIAACNLLYFALIAAVAAVQLSPSGGLATRPSWRCWCSPLSPATGA